MGLQMRERWLVSIISLTKSRTAREMELSTHPWGIIVIRLRCEDSTTMSVNIPWGGDPGLGESGKLARTQSVLSLPGCEYSVASSPERLLLWCPHHDERYPGTVSRLSCFLLEYFFPASEKETKTVWLQQEPLPSIHPSHHPSHWVSLASLCLYKYRKNPLAGIQTSSVYSVS